MKNYFDIKRLEFIFGENIESVVRINEIVFKKFCSLFSNAFFL